MTRSTIHCRSCDQPIFLGRWGKKWFPIDSQPSPDGRWMKLHGRWRRQVGVNYEMALHKQIQLHPLHDCPARNMRGARP